MSTLIERIKDKLAKHPRCKYAATTTSLETEPADGGFSVGVRIGNSAIVVNFDGWHEHFASDEDALNCFAFGLSEACRLEVVYRGDLPVRWTVQSQRDGGWVSDSTTGMVLTPFWRSRSVRHLQNNLLPRVDAGGK
jgi:hypothetical protein